MPRRQHREFTWESAINSAPASQIAEELRRQRKAIGLSLQTLSARTGLSVGYLSRLERGERQPSLPVLIQVRVALGLVDTLPAEVVTPGITEPLTDTELARIGAALGAARDVDLGTLSKALQLSVGALRLGMRRLSQHLEPLGLTVLEDGSQARLAPLPSMQAVVEALVGTHQVQLGKAQLEVMAIVAWHGQITRRRIEEIRGVSCAETLGGLVEYGLLDRDRDQLSAGRANVYRITTRTLELAGVSSRDELRQRLTTAIPEERQADERLGRWEDEDESALGGSSAPDEEVGESALEVSIPLLNSYDDELEVETNTPAAPGEVD